LATVRFERRSRDDNSWPGRGKGQQRISYGVEGQPVRILVAYDDPSIEQEKIYEHIEETWGELTESVRAPLVEAVLAAVASRHDEVAMVALSYASADVAAPPPVVYACSTARRAELIQELGYDRTLLLPPEWRQDDLELDLPPAVADGCEKLKVLVDEGLTPSDAPHALMVSLAAALGSCAWPPRLRRADDFAVYAVDAEGEDLERNVTASVPEHQIARWRDLGMLEP
jgi:hypothetical protein